MKKLVQIMFIVTAIILVGCQKVGDTKNVKIDLGQSNIYSEEDREQAVECVEEKFKEFKNCEMTKIWYDETNDYTQTVIEKGKTTIVIHSSFNTGDVSVQSGFSDNEEYEFSWTLERDDKEGQWKVVDYGVA